MVIKGLVGLIASISSELAVDEVYRPEMVLKTNQRGKLFMENPTLDVNSGEESGIGSRQECLGFEEDKFPAHCSPKLGFLCG